MSVLELVKASLRGADDEDDALLLQLIDSASRECAQYIYGVVPDYELAGTVKNPVDVPELVNGIVILVQADYEDDHARRDDYVVVARKLWWPYRNDLGI